MDSGAVSCEEAVSDKVLSAVVEFSCGFSVNSGGGSFSLETVDERNNEIKWMDKSWLTDASNNWTGMMFLLLQQASTQALNTNEHVK